MFPCVIVSIGGMDSKTKYSIALELNPVDDFHYKYTLTKWERSGYAPQAYYPGELSYTHPRSPSMGKYWMSGNLSFQNLQVTNCRRDKRGSVSG